MSDFISSFIKDGDNLILSLEAFESLRYIAIDNEYTFHARNYNPNDVDPENPVEDYLVYEVASDPSVTTYTYNIHTIVDEYHEKVHDECSADSIINPEEYDASLYIVQVYDADGNKDIAYIIDWEKFYNYVLSLLNKCNCEKCQPPLELITTILAYYNMQFSMLKGDISRFVKVWDKTMKATYVKGCGCNATRL